MSLPPATWTTGEVPTAAKMNSQIRDNWNGTFPLGSFASTAWTAILEATANPTSTEIGVTGAYGRIGPLVVVNARYKMSVGFSNINHAGSGNYFVTLPIAATGGLVANTTDGQMVGTWQAIDANTAANNQHGEVFLGSSTTIRFRVVGSLINPSAPFTWDASDSLKFQIAYFAA